MPKYLPVRPCKPSGKKVPPQTSPKPSTNSSLLRAMPFLELSFNTTLVRINSLPQDLSTMVQKKPQTQAQEPSMGKYSFVALGQPTRTKFPWPCKLQQIKLLKSSPLNLLRFKRIAPKQNPKLDTGSARQGSVRHVRGIMIAAPPNCWMRSR